MGQYYMPTIITENGEVKTLYSHEYNNGLKLMEHSYLGNDFVNAVASLIWKTKGKVAWIGDYSDGYGGDVYEKKMPQGEFLRYYKAAWRSDDPEFEQEEDGITAVHSERVHPSASEYDMNDSGLFLVNHTTKEYIDLDEFKHQNGWKESGGWRNGKYDQTITSVWCVNPLPLLTACGNGRGGGDYHDCFPCFDKVGVWAFDVLEITDERPNYESVMFEFTEQRKVG